MAVSIMAGSPISYYLSSGSNPLALTSAATDIALFKEAGPRVLATASAVTTVTTNDTLKITGTIQPSGSITISEAGISDVFTVPLVGVLQSSSTVIGSFSGTQVVTNTPLTPGNGGYIQIRTEVMQVTAGSGTTTLTVVRAQKGTTALSTLVTNDPVTQGNPPGVSTVTGGNLFAKANFAPLGLTEGDTLVLSWEFLNQ